MNRIRLVNLAMATEAVFQQKHQALRPVLEAEAKVQQDLARLDTQVQMVRTDSAGAEGYRVTGTDILWNGWEAATRRHLTTDLARLRARKIEALAELRHAFGRKQAVEGLLEAQKHDLRRAQVKKQTG